MKLLTVATDTEIEGLDRLIYSAQKTGWDIELILPLQWKGFGTKLISVYDYLIENKEVKDFVFVDAYDVLVLGTPQEFKEKLADPSQMLISVEKACWPKPDLATEYPSSPYAWKYINSGCYYSPSEVFIDLFESNPPDYIHDDQLWLTQAYLASKSGKVLDYTCSIFQSYSFIEEDDFAYDKGRVLNLKTGSTPVFIHGNGKTDMTKVIELL